MTAFGDAERGEGPAIQLALARAAQEWRDTFDSIESPVVIVEDGGQILRVNRAAQRLSGLSFDQLIGRPLAALDLAEPWRAMGRVLGAARSGTGSSSARVRDDRARSWDLVANRIAAAPGGPGRTILMARDVTASVGLEASLRRAEAFSAVGALVAGVAHEVRNPLFAISALVDAMEERFGGGVDVAQHLSTLRNELDRVARLMRDLLEYGKPLGQELVSAEIGEIVASVAKRYQLTAAERGVVVANRVPSPCASLLLDRGRMAQVIGNLLENAIQHAPLGGSVRIDARQPGTRRCVEIAIADDGAGFAEADLPHVFEPFFTRRPGGTGLGLSIAQRIAEAHGGHLAAANGPDGGAVVVMTLPIADDAASAGPEP